jgi:hypothetical protein
MITRYEEVDLGDVVPRATSESASVDVRDSILSVARCAGGWCASAVDFINSEQFAVLAADYCAVHADLCDHVAMTRFELSEMAGRSEAVDEAMDYVYDASYRSADTWYTLLESCGSVRLMGLSIHAKRDIDRVRVNTAGLSRMRERSVVMPYVFGSVLASMPCHGSFDSAIRGALQAGEKQWASRVHALCVTVTKKISAFYVKDTRPLRAVLIESVQAAVVFGEYGVPLEARSTTPDESMVDIRALALRSIPAGQPWWIREGPLELLASRGGQEAVEKFLSDNQGLADEMSLAIARMQICHLESGIEAYDDVLLYVEGICMRVARKESALRPWVELFRAFSTHFDGLAHRDGLRAIRMAVRLYIVCRHVFGPSVCKMSDACELMMRYLTVDVFDALEPSEQLIVVECSVECLGCVHAMHLVDRVLADESITKYDMCMALALRGNIYQRTATIPECVDMYRSAMCVIFGEADVPKWCNHSEHYKKLNSLSERLVMLHASKDSAREKMRVAGVIKAMDDEIRQSMKSEAWAVTKWLLPRIAGLPDRVCEAFRLVIQGARLLCRDHEAAFTRAKVMLLKRNWPLGTIWDVYDETSVESREAPQLGCTRMDEALRLMMAPTSANDKSSAMVRYRRLLNVLRREYPHLRTFSLQYMQFIAEHTEHIEEQEHMRAALEKMKYSLGIVSIPGSCEFWDYGRQMILLRFLVERGLAMEGLHDLLTSVVLKVTDYNMNSSEFVTSLLGACCAMTRRVHVIRPDVDVVTMAQYYEWLIEQDIKTEVTILQSIFTLLLPMQKADEEASMSIEAHVYKMEIELWFRSGVGLDTTREAQRLKDLRPLERKVRVS